MDLTRSQYREVLSLLRKKFLKDNKRYKETKLTFIGSFLTTCVLALIHFFFPELIIETVAGLVMAPSAFISALTAVFTIAWLWDANNAVQMWAQLEICSYDTYKDLLEHLDENHYKKGVKK